MAIRRMNEMWRRLALHSVLSVLLLQGCQGQGTTEAQHNQSTNMPPNDFTRTSTSPPINTTTLIPSESQSSDGERSSLSTGSPARFNTTSTQSKTQAYTASPMGERSSTNITIKDGNTNAYSAAVTNHTKNEENNATEQLVGSSGNQASLEMTEKPNDSNVSQQAKTSVAKEKENQQSETSVTNEKEKLQTETPIAKEKENLQTETPIAKKTGNLQTETPIAKEKDNLQTETPIAEETGNSDTRAEGNVNSAETSSNKKKVTVLVSVLLAGLTLAAVLIGVYVKKNHCQTKGNSMKLAEESDHADEENQGNTLVSVAPLNPPEDQEKPNQNGESLEAVKIQNPPAATNGHSATKADTEF